MRRNTRRSPSDDHKKRSRRSPSRTPSERGNYHVDSNQNNNIAYRGSKREATKEVKYRKSRSRTPPRGLKRRSPSQEISRSSSVAAEVPHVTTRRMSMQQQQL